MATVTFQQTVNGYTGTSDTMVRESKPQKDFGSAQNVNVDGVDTAGMLNEGLLYFADIFGDGPGQIPVGATITSATLTLSVSDATNEPFSLHRMLFDWAAASSWTWNSFGNGIQADGTEAMAAADLTMSGIGKGVKNLDVTQSLQAWSGAAANFGWLFTMSGSNGWDFSSSEGPIAPKLTVEYSLAAAAGLHVVESGGSTVVAEGGADDSITVALKSAPSGDVTVTIAGNADVSVKPATLTFTPGNWNTPQTVTVSAVDDTLVEGTEVHSVTLSSSSSDSSYDGRTASVSVTVSDNDAPPPPSGGLQVHDAMLRQSKPATSYVNADSVNVDGSDSAGLRNQGLLYFENLFGDGAGQVPEGAVINSATLTLNVTDGTSQPITFHRMLRDWTALSSVTWNGLGNGIQTDGVEAVATADVTLASMASGTRNIDVTQSVRAWANGAVNFGWALLMDGSNGWEFTSSEGTVAPRLTVDWSIPTPGLAVTESGGSTVVTEGGQGDSIMVALRTAPTANVTVEIEGNSELSIGPTTLIFTPGNWATPQAVSLTAVDDTDPEPREVVTVTLTSSSADSAYNGRTATVSVTTHDNDSAEPSPLQLSVVHIHDTTEWKAGDPSGYGCSDPSGIAYVPGLNLLFIADSEHDESPFFSPTNLFAVRPDGTHVASYSLRDFSDEPTGLAYNPHNGFLYITDDDADQIFWVNPANPEVLLGQFDVDHLGIEDAEDPEIDPVTGNLYVLDGDLAQMFELTPTGDLVRVVDLPTPNAEGLTYDAARDVFYLSSGASSGTIYEVDPDGTLINSYTLLNGSAYRHPEGGHKPKLKGLELAPSSDPNDGNRKSLYVGDYGVDQVADGRLFELDLGPDFLLS